MILFDRSQKKNLMEEEQKRKFSDEIATKEEENLAKRSRLSPEGVQQEENREEFITPSISIENER